MATNFPRTLGDDDEFEVPPEELQAMQALQAKINTPRKPRYSPEEQAQRKQSNDRDYALGMLGLYSQNETLHDAGAQIFKRALAEREEVNTDHGTYDKLSGNFTVNPEYQQQRDEEALNATLNRLSGQRIAWKQGRTAARERQTQREQDFENRKELVNLTADRRPPPAQPLVAVVGPDGTPVLKPRAEAAGMQPAAKPSNAQPTQDEAKAANWTDQASLAFKNMRAATASDPSSASPSFFEKTLTMGDTKLGKTAAYALMTPSRQQFTTAASSLSEAILRAATGAGIAQFEAEQKVDELTPRWGESEQTIAMKQEMALSYIASLKQRAGRAPVNQSLLPPEVAASQAAVDPVRAELERLRAAKGK